jgi:hypothetical protein
MEWTWWSLVLLLVCPTVPRALGASERNPRSVDFKWEGEEFFYSLRVSDAEAMRASIKTGELRRSDGRPYVPIALRVQSLGFFHEIYSVDDHADTFMDPSTFRPYRSEKYFKEAGEKRAYLVDYLHGNYHARVEKREPNKVHKFKEAIPGSTHDMITWLYELRSREIVLGDRFEFYVYDGWKISHVHMEVVSKEDLYTPAGWFKSWKIRFVRKIVDAKTRKENGEKRSPKMRVKTAREHDGYFWLSRDENHLPLRITIGTEFGYGEAVLIKYNRHETD